MRFGLVDLLFAIGCLAVGMVLGLLVAAYVPAPLRLITGYIAGICLYLALVYPFYTRLKLLPMILPRCPCCARYQPGFDFVDGWPRVMFRCKACDGQFVIWHDGKVGASETWETPVLVLKWPYAWGRYKRIERPGPGTTPNSGPAARSGTSKASGGPPSVS